MATSSPYLLAHRDVVIRLNPEYLRLSSGHRGLHSRFEGEKLLFVLFSCLPFLGYGIKRTPVVSCGRECRCVERYLTVAAKVQRKFSESAAMMQIWCMQRWCSYGVATKQLRCNRSFLRCLGVIIIHKAKNRTSYACKYSIEWFWCTFHSVWRSKLCHIHQVCISVARCCRKTMSYFEFFFTMSLKKRPKIRMKIVSPHF